MADASNISKLSQQILGQGISDKWQGQGHGSAKANADDMAKILDGIGITDIKQFGNVSQYAKAEARTGEDGKQVYGTMQAEWQGSGEDGGYVEVFVPIADQSKVIIKNGEPVFDTGQKAFGNTVTGQVVPNTYAERQTENAWGGTFAGKGNTGYRVDFSTGQPIFYTTAASSNSLVNMIGDNKLLAIAANVAAAFYGGPLGTAALQAAQGKDIGDIIKSAALTYVGGQVSGAVSGTESVVDMLGQAGANIAGKVAGAVVTGRDPVTAAISGGVGTMAGESVGLTGDMASTIGTSVVSGVAASLRGQDVTDAMVAGAVTGYLSNSKDIKGLKKASDEDLAAGLDPAFGSNGAYDGFMQGAMGPDAMSAIEDSITNASDNANAFDATANEGSLTKTVSDGSLLSTVGDAASKVFTGMSGADAVKAGVLTGLATTTTKSNDLTVGGGLGSRTTTANTSTLNLNQDDIYKDAPIKGYHMKQNAEGRYIPYIGDRALLAKGGFVSKRN